MWGEGGVIVKLDCMGERGGIENLLKKIKQ